MCQSRSLDASFPRHTARGPLHLPTPMLCQCCSRKYGCKSQHESTMTGLGRQDSVLFPTAALHHSELLWSAACCLYCARMLHDNTVVPDGMNTWVSGTTNAIIPRLQLGHPLHFIRYPTLSVRFLRSLNAICSKSVCDSNGNTPTGFRAHCPLVLRLARIRCWQVRPLALR